MLDLRSAEIRDKYSSVWSHDNYLWFTLNISHDHTLMTPQLHQAAAERRKNVIFKSDIQSWFGLFFIVCHSGMLMQWIWMDTNNKTVTWTRHLESILVLVISMDDIQQIYIPGLSRQSCLSRSPCWWLGCWLIW